MTPMSSKPRNLDPADGSGLGEQALAKAVRASMDPEDPALETDDSLVAKAAAGGLEFEATPEPGGTALNIVAAALPLVIGLFFLVMGQNLNMGALNNPGPRLWPFILSIACIVSAVVLFIFARTGSGTEKFTAGVKYVALGAVSLLAYSVIESVGFELPTLVVAVVWLKLIGRETWLSTLLYGVGAVVAVYLIFIIGLRVSLPHLLPI